MPEITRFPVEKTDAEWRAILTPEHYAVIRERRRAEFHPDFVPRPVPGV